MKRSLIAAALALAALSAMPAEARPRHHHRHHHHRAAGGGQPAECAGIAWCGCWLRLKLGISDPGRKLDVARAWTSVGSPASAPAAGVIAVWPHHVGLITGVLPDGQIMMISGNDANAVRERPRSTRGIIALRRV